MKYHIPLDEYPRRCVNQINEWKEMSKNLIGDSNLGHTRSHEYASYIMEAMVTGKPYSIGGNVLNTGHLITDFPETACVEVPCLVDGSGITPCHMGELPLQLAAMNASNIYPQLLTIKAAATLEKKYIYNAAMMDPLTGTELNIKDIYAMVDEMLEAHKDWLPEYH